MSVLDQIVPTEVDSIDFIVRPMPDETMNVCRFPQSGIQTRTKNDDVSDD